MRMCLLCVLVSLLSGNHQRSIPKGHDAQIGKMKETMQVIIDDRDELEDWIEEVRTRHARHGPAVRQRV